MNGEAMKLLAENDGVSELEVDTETVRSSAVPLPVWQKINWNKKDQALRPGALGRPGGIGWRGRWGGIGMGNTCKPMAVSLQCMTKSTTI